MMSGTNVNDWTIDYYIENKPTCNLILRNVHILREIPSLNYFPLDDFRDGQLVRYEGMVQDIRNPEHYYENFEVKNLETGECYLKSGMYRDIMKCAKNEQLNLESSNNKRDERKTYVVISIPGLNPWAKELNPPGKINSNSSCSNPAGKRSLEDDQGEPMDSSNLEPAPKKEKSDKHESQTDALDTDEKKPMVVSKEYLLNFPIPIDDGKSAIVKVYADCPTFKLNQLIEIIGFISKDPILSHVNNSDEYLDNIEVQIHHPPASIIPRVHAIIAKPLLLIPELTMQPEFLSHINMVRGDLHMVLSQLLFGDNLAADFVICHLLSSVYMRRDFLCLGNFPLNITNFPRKFSTFPKDIYNFLSKIVAKSHYFECTLDALNELSLVPKKDYDSNRLTSGMLQLSKNTHLIIDETNLTSGQVSVSGQLNYRAISDLARFQKLSYDFKFYALDYETDIPVLILSKVKSFIPCIMQIPLKSDPETEDMYAQVVEAANQYLSGENRLNNIRYYLESCRRITFVPGEDICSVIQEDFVELRKVNKFVTADNLHSMIVFAKLMAMSYGEDSLTVERWKQAFGLENERMSRLPRRNE
ncbi:mini-chromosome maintenance complex-binding protein [Chelonus insularis]|uniref:mini-chromosome maintenance complex-binding protein n=1 Tax=Chelonus insularis TaxID=460826 RepID=UPI00158B3613|nr:mini-chromosome maintenance complex-binding protein [Chelonus insularis]